jgi:hypothetical protein
MGSAGKRDTTRYFVLPLFVIGVYLAGAVVLGIRLLAGTMWTQRIFRDARSIRSELWEHFDLIAMPNIDIGIEESDRVRAPLTT